MTSPTRGQAQTDAPVEEAVAPRGRGSRVSSPKAMSRSAAAGNPGLREGGHTTMASDRRPQDIHGERRAGAFTQPHVEIEQHRPAQLLHQTPMPSLGRNMPDHRM